MPLFLFLLARHSPPTGGGALVGFCLLLYQALVAVTEQGYAVQLHLPILVGKQPKERGSEVPKKNGNDKPEQTDAEETVEKSQAEQELEKATAIVSPMASKGKSEDEMIVNLINDGGFGYKKAARLLNKALETLGVRLSAKDRYEKVCELLLEHDFKAETWDEVVKVAQWMAEEIDSTDEKQAMVAIRKYAKDNGLELPKKPKAVGGGRGPGLKGQVMSRLVDIPNESVDDFKKWVSGETERPELVKYYTSLRELCDAVHDAKLAA
jgi:hypothetical protein